MTEVSVQADDHGESAQKQWKDKEKSERRRLGVGFPSRVCLQWPNFLLRGFHYLTFYLLPVNLSWGPGHQDTAFRGMTRFKPRLLGPQSHLKDVTYCTPVCENMSRLEVGIRYHPGFLSNLFFSGRVSHWNCRSLTRLSWLDNKPWQSLCLYLPSAGNTGVSHHTAFTWVMGSELRSLCLSNKHVLNWVISPSLRV